MKSSLPKVLHPLAGLPLLAHILLRVRDAAPHSPVAIVVGHGREQVESEVRSDSRFSKMDLCFVVQSEQRGTGHAARCVMDSDWGKKRLLLKQSVLVLPGDLPLITRGLLDQLLMPLHRGESMRVLTTILDHPTGYGRIVRRGKVGPVLRIVEEKDANTREKAIREVAVSIYHFDSAFLNFGLQRLSNKNAQGEFYLTDLVSQASRAKKKMDVLVWGDPQELRGINDPYELAQVARILNDRILKQWLLEGVTVMDLVTTWIEPTVRISSGVVIHPGAILTGNTEVAEGAILGPSVVLKDVEVGAGAYLKVGTVAENAKIGAHCQVGPYAHLRPGTVLGIDVKIGNFVELKETRVGNKSSIAHLSYLGDAEVGSRANIGCGFVTCNFDGRVIDGRRKHRTIIEDDVFMGSDCQTVAPVRVGKGAYVASGSTITDDVPADSLAIARSKQVNKIGYALRLRSQQEG